ncbi:MAG: hypothetical protein PHR81_10680 [Bacteroidales bacterium]|jgi:hypothetical protein|nr:hypothetical protein [Bacteroidales bacterium]MDD4215267.1 hypothetical protein [Bacteroidales bacterium]
MKKLKILAMILFIGIIAASCEKEGPAGPAGTNGTNGIDGTDGNANVTVYGFGETVLNAVNLFWVSFKPAELTSGMVDSSFILAYYKSGATVNYPWYSGGGIGPDGLYQTKMFIYRDPTSVDLRLYNPDGSAYSSIDVTWDSVRIFIVPANIFRNAEMEKVNFNDYSQVSNYFSNK